MHNGDYFVFQCKTEEAMDVLIDAAHRSMTPQTAAELEENRKEDKKIRLFDNYFNYLKRHLLWLMKLRLG